MTPFKILKQAPNEKLSKTQDRILSEKLKTHPKDRHDFFISSDYSYSLCLVYLLM